MIISITDPSRAPTPQRGPSTTPLPTFPRRLKKPTATKIEAGLDATAGAAFKAAFVIIVFGVLLIGCIAVIAG